MYSTSSMISFIGTWRASEIAHHVDQGQATAVAGLSAAHDPTNRKQ
jgi:hypothetical protein